MPTPAEFEETEAPALAVNQENPGSYTATPSPPPPADPQSSPAHPTEAPPLYIMQLCNQLQRIEARCRVPTCTKCSTCLTCAANSVATPSVGAGKTEETHYSSNVEPDAFDWNTPYETQPPSPSAPAPPTDIAESSGARKRKAPAARVIREDTPLDQPADPPTQPSPAKRRRRLHIILRDSGGDEDNNEDGSDDPASSRSLGF
ncbi:hypothetical protein V6N12_068571 [Hibiscus sabdariffa]|uniref:Uncharacterized protein n=1 Tax=Hibiscus sabdariffa TaxID=183260 RepID=A0ABR2FQC3_9ROSI